jgi:putative membrane protein
LTERASDREPRVLLGLGAVALLVSGIEPHDRLTWVLEVVPAVLAAAILVATRRRFPLTPLLYRLIFFHSLVLMLGGHYTYALVPLGFWAQDLFGFARNHYDRVGHFMQGVTPVLVAREVLLRTSPLRPGRWLGFLSICVTLAASAFYEFTEWWAALLGGEAADSFLGTQGDVWDTQWDMFMCLCGALVSSALLGGLHSRQLASFGGDRR